MIGVRRATDADAEAMSRVLTSSITELCAADHGNDPDLVAAWTANKTPEGIRAMLANPATQLFVAERDGELAAVGSIDDRGRIGLNYVAPWHRFAGVSRALLGAMEDALRAAGVREATLESTATAHRFYLAAGWDDDGPAEAGRFIVDHPMRKRL